MELTDFQRSALQQADHILIIDFEATCGRGITPGSTEIIEMGAVLLSWPDLEEVSMFQRYVRPTINPRLTNFCSRFTGIDQHEVDSADPFPIVLSELIEDILCEKHVVFMDWSGFDWRQLKVECERNNLENPFVLGKWDLQALFKKNQRLKHSPSVTKALSIMGMEFIGRQHSGFDDARNTARLTPHAIPISWRNIKRESLGLPALIPLTPRDIEQQKPPSEG